MNTLNGHRTGYKQRLLAFVNAIVVPERQIKPIVALATAYPKSTVFISLLLSSLASLGTFLMERAVNHQHLLSETHPLQQTSRMMRSKYGKSDSINIIVFCLDCSIVSKRGLKFVHNLTEALQSGPHKVRVESLTHFPYRNRHSRIGRVVNDPDSLSDADLAEIRNVLQKAQTSVGATVNPDQRAALVRVFAELPEKSADSLEKTYEWVTATIKSQQDRDPRFEVLLGGLIPFSMQSLKSTARDLKFLVPVLAATLGLLTAMIYRSIAFAAMLLFYLSLVILSCYGIGGWAKLTLSDVLVDSSFIIATLAVADFFHIASSLAQKKGQATHPVNIAAAVAENIRPIMLTSLTGSIGFLALSLSIAPPLREAGMITSIGIGISLILAFTLVPALFVLSGGSANCHKEFQPRIFHGDRWPKRKNIPLLSFGLLTLLSIVLLSKLELNDDFIGFYDESTKFRQDAEKTKQLGIGTYDVEYSVESGKVNGVKDPQYLQDLDRLVSWHREQPEVVDALSLSEILKYTNWVNAKRNDEFYTLPTKDVWIDSLISKFQRHRPDSWSPQEFVTSDYSASRVVISLKHISTTEVLSLVERAQAFLEANGISGARAFPSGAVYNLSALSQENTLQMLKGAIFVGLAIFIIMVVGLQDAKIGAAVLICSAIPIVLVLGLWSLLVGTIGFEISTFIAISIGIAIDDPIHFASAYSNERKNGADWHTAIRAAFTKVGGAISATTIVMFAGFCVLLLSTFWVLKVAAALTGISIVLSMAATFTLLPSLLSLKTFSSGSNKGKPDSSLTGAKPEGAMMHETAS